MVPRYTERIIHMQILIGDLQRNRSGATGRLRRDINKNSHTLFGRGDENVTLGAQGVRGRADGIGPER